MIYSINSVIFASKQNTVMPIVGCLGVRIKYYQKFRMDKNLAD